MKYLSIKLTKAWKGKMVRRGSSRMEINAKFSKEAITFNHMVIQRQIQRKAKKILLDYLTQVQN
jgi:hypothetical protein